MDIGLAIKEIRLRKGIPREYFAKNICEVSTVTLRAIEKGARRPSEKVIAALQKNLGLPYSHILLYSFTVDDIEKDKIPMFVETREALLKSISKPYVFPEGYVKKKPKKRIPKVSRKEGLAQLQ